MGETNIDEFKNFADKDLVRSDDLGQMSFQEVSEILDDLKNLLSEMISVIDTESNVPQGLKNNVARFVSKFNNIAKKIRAYDIQKDQNFNDRQKIINEVKNYYNSIFDYRQSNNESSLFLPTFNALKNLKKSNIESISSSFEEIKEDYSKAKSEYEKLSETVSSEAAKETFSDYAEIFNEQADRHSTVSTSKIGSAEIFFIVGTLLSIGLVVFLLTSFLSIDPDMEIKSAVAVVLRKFLFLSFLAFGIKFCFKQFSINKHLSTLNKHRANALNSFRLFSASIPSEESNTRNTLMIELAKSIFEQGNTGYIEKDGQNKSSIVEVSKLLNQSTNS